MIHSQRRFQLHVAYDPASLANRLTQPQCECIAVLVDDYVFLNDSRIRDETQVYAIWKLGCGWPLEVTSLTVSGRDADELLGELELIANGYYDGFAISRSNAVLRLDAPKDHRCLLCR